MDLDLGFDAPRYGDVEEDMFWVTQNTPLVIQGVPEFHKGIELPLAFKVKKEGEFTIGIDKLENVPGDFDILLKDKTSGETYDLRDSDHTFTATPDLGRDRFSIVFTNEKKLEEEIKEESGGNVEIFYSQNDKVLAIHNPDKITIEKASVYNLNGQHLYTYGYIPSLQRIELAVALKTTGVYIVRLETEKGTLSKKFIIQ